MGKSCMLMRYVENTFTTAFYNTIGVDFVTLTRYPQKIKNVEIDGRKVRLQIVLHMIKYSGTPPVKIVSVPSPQPTTKEPTGSCSCTM